MDDWFIQAFWWLDTERLYQHGAIPWTARMTYADTYGLDIDNATTLAVVVNHLDRAYQAFRVEEAEKESKAHGRDVKVPK